FFSHSLYCFFFFLFLRHPSSSTLFPYTTLFRSHDNHGSPRESCTQASYRRRDQYGRRRQGDPRRSSAPFSSATRDRELDRLQRRDRKSTRLNSSHVSISYAVFCLKKKKD